jgi:GT2 family glycosyltransferase
MLSRLISSGVSVVDLMRRVRYRRADLHRIAPSEMQSDPEGLSFRWTSGGRQPFLDAVLICPANSRVVYDLTLPPGARVLAWCALEQEAAARAASVEFEILVQVGGSQWSTRRLVSQGHDASWRRWRSLRLKVPTAGHARIILQTRATGGTIPDDVQVVWGGPRLEMPRALAQLGSELCAAISGRDVRRLWYLMAARSAHRLYALWVRKNEPSRRALRAQRDWAVDHSRQFTLITCVTDSEQTSSGSAASVLAQTYPHWEWVLVVAGSPGPPESRATPDPRVRCLNVPPQSGRAAAWTAALRQARGEFALLLEDGDIVAPGALYELARALEDQPDADVLYSDEDRLDGPGRGRHTPCFKPDWSPDLLLSCNYIGRLTAFRSTVALSAGGFSDEYPGAEEWEFWLRLSGAGARFRRLPRCLYHAAAAPPPPSPEHVRLLLSRHCEKLGLRAGVTTSEGVARVSWDVQGAPLVSIIIPNRNAATILKQCVRGILEATSYRRIELIIVDNQSSDPEVLEFYDTLTGRHAVRVLSFDRPFNYSAACNAGAAVARGDLLLFLNNDVEVIQPDWLEELVRWAQLPNVGVVGGKLLYPDRRIQHAGIVFGLGLVGHIFSGAPEKASGVFGSTECYRNYLAVTGACQMMRKDVFLQLGGYDERFRLSFSDVVLCMEAWKAGYRVVYTPHACLVHLESYTREGEDLSEDVERLAAYLQRTGFVEDPYFHPALNAKSTIPAVRPPFEPTPGEVVHASVERVLSTVRVSRPGED